jgi:hypothetical protein
MTVLSHEENMIYCYQLMNPNKVHESQGRCHSHKGNKSIKYILGDWIEHSNKY